MAIILELGSLLFSVGSLAMSLYVASHLQKKYGDVAAVVKDWDFQKKEAKRARVMRFQSLINQVARIRKLTEYYKSPFPDFGAPKMPMTAFETAFVSGSPGLIAGSELLKAVNEYLVRADIVNSVIDMHLTKGDRQGAEFSDITRACEPLSEILNRLDKCLEHELEA